MNDKIINVDSSNFNDVVLKNDKPVLVHFWASWDGACKQLETVLDGMADDYDNEVIFAKLDVDKNQDIVSKYEVQSLPTCILFNGERVVDIIVDAQPRSKFEEFLEKHL